MRVKAAMRTARGHLLGHYRRPLPKTFVAPLVGGRALEIGGPSAVFGLGHLLPVYPVLGQIDGVQPVAETFWHNLDPDAGYVVDGSRRGQLHIVDDVALTFIESGTYDVVLSSHVLEHIANPLRALFAWRRVVRPGGYLLVIVPHLAGTFDHRRPLTSLSHMINDLAAGVTEDDQSHIEESIRLHDRTRDGPWARAPEFDDLLRDNVHTRRVHHHTFTTLSLIDLLGYAGVQVLAAETRLPHDIYVLGQWTTGSPDNGEFVATAGHSPFRIDRRESAKRQRAAGAVTSAATPAVRPLMLQLD